MRFALVTPARNERENLERLAASILAQDLRPVAWVVVDDSSDDGTAELVAEHARAHPWIHVVRAERAAGALSEGRREGRALESFKHGVRALRAPADVVMKVDADTSFDAGYIAGLAACFAAEPRLGIAGGACVELERGEWRRQKVSRSHPRGASRAYRAELMEDVLALEPRMGWDGIDEVKARLRGFESRTILELAFRHHRATGGRERSRLRHQAAQGRAAWYMGYRSSYLLLRTAYRTPRQPSAIGMVFGYARAGLAREARCPDRDVVRALRREQRLGAVIRQGSPP